MKTESTHPDFHLTDRLHWVVALWPIFTVLLFYSVVLHGRLELGEWPAQTNTRADDLSDESALFGLHGATVFIAIMMTSISPLAWLALLSQAHTFASLSQYGLRFAVFLGSLTTAVWLGRSDPGRLLQWFFD